MQRGSKIYSRKFIKPNSVRVMSIFIASDHAGFELKDRILRSLDLGMVDLGTDQNLSCDYPCYANKLALRIAEDDENVGILICGSGVGMSIAANRYPWIRAALCCSPEIAEIARRHNDANVLVLGARYISEHDSIECVKKFLNTPFDGGRHAARIKMLNEYV